MPIGVDVHWGTENMFSHSMTTLFPFDPTSQLGPLYGTWYATNGAQGKEPPDQIKEAMIAVDQVIDWETTKMHLTVHDELDFSVPKGEAGIKVGRLIKEAMEDHDVSVPLRAEVKIGRDWAHAETQPALQLAA